jgi:uncharacterized tellurite resistance protein B-like protein
MSYPKACIFKWKRKKTMSEEIILEGHSDSEKGAYLGAIASLATADRTATPEELEHIEELCNAAGLPDNQKQAVLRAATELSGEELTRCLEILKNSELKYSLVADLIAFSKSDRNYSEEEKQGIKKITTYLGVDQQQFKLLDEFTEKATPAELTSQDEHSMILPNNFMDGLKEKLQGAGINTNSLFKGILAVAAPLMLSGLFKRRRTPMPGGMGSPLGGLSGLAMGGGLASVIGMLSGGRGMSGLGGLLGRKFGTSW